MKRFIIITACIMAICSTMFILISVQRNTSPITAKGGIIDLTGADFTGTVYTLDGEWEFYYGAFYSPEDFASGRAGEKKFIQSPASWDEAGYPLAGYATYRMTLLTDEPDLMMLMPMVQDSSAVWLNGKLAYNAGTPGTSKETAVGSIKNGFVTMHPENGRVEFVMQTSNFRWRFSGLEHSVRFGRPRVLINDAVSRRAALTLVLGAFLTMGLYHAVLFVYQRREWAYLAFALTCLIGAFRFFLETNGIAALLLPNGLGAVLGVAVTQATVLHMAALTFFVHTAFSLPIKSIPRRIIYALMFLVPMAILLTRLPRIFIFLMLIPIGWSAVSMARAGRLKENPYNALFFAALCFFTVWSPFYTMVIEDQLYMPGILPNLFLTLSQCVMLSVNYAETKRREEELERKSDFYHQMAHDLLTPLTVVSTNIQVADSMPDKAGDRLKQSQKEIMKMSEMINAALKGGDDE